MFGEVARSLVRCLVSWTTVDDPSSLIPYLFRGLALPSSIFHLPSSIFRLHPPSSILPSSTIYAITPRSKLNNLHTTLDRSRYFKQSTSHSSRSSVVCCHSHYRSPEGRFGSLPWQTQTLMINSNIKPTYDLSFEAF